MSKARTAPKSKPLMAKPLTVMTILGTRPEIIRLSRLIARLDAARGCRHVLVHTGQNTHAGLSDVFFRELGIRKPDHHLDCSGDNAPARVGKILTAIHPLLVKEKPDRILILGDTFSGLSAYPARLLGIPVYHMEAGNRCFDPRVPEEVNRPLIDRLSRYNLPYTEHSRRHLLQEGFDPASVLVTGNPINEVLQHYMPRVAKSAALKKHGLKKGGYFLASFHRAENVDDRRVLGEFVAACGELAERHKRPVLVSTHPRTADRMQKAGLGTTGKAVRFLEPMGFFDFVALMRSAALVLSDSGTVPEEAAILGVPAVQLRRSTERTELVECGASIMGGTELQSILRAAEQALALKGGWTIPLDYAKLNVSETVCNILLAGEGV